MTATLRCRQLSRDFRGFRAVDAVDLDVIDGSVHALVGPNGAGKTTLFNLLTGFLSPTSGRVEMAGRDVTGLPPERVTRLGVARSFQITSLFPGSTCLEHLELALSGRDGLGWRCWRTERLMRRYTDRALALLAQVGLTDQAAAVASSLPYGRKRALELAIALTLEP
ncbi:MAG TPA: ATP-binding cassette domain-containing protein, partial [Micromonosporaceae bacterium]